MKTPSVLPPLVALFVAGCAHAPRSAAPPDLKMSEAMKALEAFACMPPALYATALIEGDAPEEEKRRADEAKWRASTQPAFEQLAALYTDAEKIADARDEYADVDAAHTRLRILITRRDGRSVVVERTFEKQPDAKP